MPLETQIKKLSSEISVHDVHKFLHANTFRETGCREEILKSSSLKEETIRVEGSSASGDFYGEDLQFLLLVRLIGDIYFVEH